MTFVPQDSASRFTPVGWRPSSSPEEDRLVALAGEIVLAFHHGTPESWETWCAEHRLEASRDARPLHDPIQVEIAPQDAQVRLLEGLWDVLMPVIADGTPRGCLVTLYDPWSSPLLTSRPAMVP